MFKLLTRIARWYIVKPKIPIWVNFGGPWNGKGWYILWPFGILRSFVIFYGDLVFQLQFGIFSPILVYCVKKNLATLFLTLATHKKSRRGKNIFIPWRAAWST
jgi:hypothetical protein